MDKQDNHLTRAEEFPPARELAVWLRAVASFFNQANQPLSQTERDGISTRDFKCETQVVRDALLRCLHLLGSVEGGEPARVVNASEPAAQDGEQAGAREGAQGLAGVKDSLRELADALKDACKLCEALLDAPTVAFAGWSGLGRMIERELGRSEAAALIRATEDSGEAARARGPLVQLAERLTPDELGEDMASVFSAFERLLGLLRFIEFSLTGDAQLKRVLPVFALVNEETRSLIAFIEGRAMRVRGLDRGAQEILDGTAYAIRMEMRKAFEHELVGLCSMRQPMHIFAKVENANGLLRDCYQQSVVALAQSFDPLLDGRRLFPSFQTKLDQSLQLRRDLWDVVTLVRRASAEGESFTPPRLLEALKAFAEGSQRFLMFKDWEPLERFEDEVESARSPSELSRALHRFEAFLETLFGQVNMRAVLADHPFDPNSTAV